MELQVYDNSVEIDAGQECPPMPTLILHMSAGIVRSRLDASQAPAWARPVIDAGLAAASGT